MRTRLDMALVARGLAPTRERARALILAGQVKVNATVISKAGTPVADDAAIELVQPDHPYVGRGGVKLAHALDIFHIPVSARHALDIGASTGGFTDVLLQRGATDVIALDVGHGQLDWRLRNDPRVLVRERVNARTLTTDDVPHQVDIVTIDVSFISLKLILPSIGPFLGPGADVVALVKPQFEAGRQDVGPGGIVSSTVVHDRVIASVSDEAARLGLTTVAMTPSPITGASGNREFFLHLRAAAAPSNGVELLR